MQRYWRMRRNRVREKSCIKRWYSCMKLQEDGIWRSDTCIQGIKELGESEELKLTHIRLICADPAVNRDTCALKIKEYVTEDTELLENAEFKKLQKEYGIKAEGGNIWVGR